MLGKPWKIITFPEKWLIKQFYGIFRQESIKKLVFCLCETCICLQEYLNLGLLEINCYFAVATQEACSYSKLATQTCSKLTMATLKRCQWRRLVVFIVDYEHILPLFLAFLLLFLNIGKCGVNGMNEINGMKSIMETIWTIYCNALERSLTVSTLTQTPKLPLYRNQ